MRRRFTAGNFDRAGHGDNAVILMTHVLTNQEREELCEATLETIAGAKGYCGGWGQTKIERTVKCCRPIGLSADYKVP
jgi:hypothetical protein